MARMTGWEAVVQALRAERVARVYGLPGDPRHLYEALYDAPEIQAVLVRHEASGVFMAMAESRVLGTVGVCHSSPGPGMTNTVSGLLEAHSACQPIVCICTGTPAEYVGMGAFQEHDGVGVARPVTKWSVRVEHPERIPWTMQRAFAVARGGKPGPVYVEIPSDVGLAAAEMDEYRRIPGPLRSAPDPADVRAAAELLRGSSRPVLVAGGGVVASAASEALVRLAEQEQIPVMTTLSGRGSIAEDHELAFGLTGLYRTRPGRDVFNAADLLVTVGARMEGFQSGDWKIYPPGARFLQIDLDPFEIGRNWVPDVALAGDARLALEALAGALAGEPGNRDERGRTAEAAVEAKAAFADEVDRECEAATAVPLQSKRIVHELNRVFGRDTILVNENGGQDLWTYFHPYYRVLDAGHAVVPGEQTCMGAGVTGAVGAKLARPDAKVVCVTGDGAFQMMPQELSTAVQYGAPVTWVVLNTRSLGWSQWRQRDSGRLIATDFESQPDFDGARPRAWLPRRERDRAGRRSPGPRARARPKRRRGAGGGRVRRLELRLLPRLRELPRPHLAGRRGARTLRAGAVTAARASRSRTAAPAGARATDRRLIQSVDRSIQLLNALALSRHPLSVAELAAACELNRSTAWRLLSTLEHHGLVERDGVSQRYAIGYALVRMAAGKTDHAILIRTARPALEKIAAATGETVNLSIVTAAGTAVCIDQVDAVPLVAVNWLDRPLPWHCTSAGKLHLAFLAPDELDAYLAQGPFEALTGDTITDPARLREELALTRERGYSLNVNELEVGLHSVSAGVPLAGRPVAMISVSGPSFRLPESVLHRLGDELVETGLEVGSQLGAQMA